MLLTIAAAAAPATLSGCNTAQEIFRGERQITDHANRTLTIPTASELKKVYFTSALAQIFCFTLNPDMLAGTGIRFTAQELELLPGNTASLPYLGSLSGGGEIDREALLAEGVQVVFSVSGVALTDANISEAEKLQDQTGIPTILVDGSFDNIAEAYRFMGDVMGCADRAETLASYCERVYNDVTAAVASVPEDQRVSLYYAEGSEGLQTEPAESEHAVAFTVAGARNVAKVSVVAEIGMSSVSLEQVLAWDPEVIVAWDNEVRGGADEIIRTSSLWSPIRAVSTGRVYTMPNVPFAWCDRPPGVNRFIGIQWLANMLYPDAYDVDMVDVVREFYSTFYWVDIDDAKARELLGNSYPPYGKG